MPDLCVDRGGPQASVFGCRDDVPAAVCDYTDQTKRAHVCFSRAEQRIVEQLRPPDWRAQFGETDLSKTSRITGRLRLQRIRDALKGLGLAYSDDQKEFIDRMIAAAAKLIFKTDLQENVEDLLAELKISELRQELMAIMPRRFGKTFCVAAFVVAAAMGIEGVEIGIFSTGRRASQKMLELVYWFFTKLGNVNIIKHNVEVIWIQGPYGPNDIRKISSYPSNVRISLQQLTPCRVLVRAVLSRRWWWWWWWW